MTYRSVELRPAYAWDCEVCGQENFERGGVPDLDEADLAALKEEDGIEPWEIGQFVMMPTSVTCKRCFSQFSSLRSGSDQVERP